MRRYVPPEPGPLLRSRRDEDDAVLDDLFGPPDDDGPGAFDIALVAAGIGLLVGGLVADLTGLVVLGALVLLLGLVLPLRSVLRRRGLRSRAPGLPLAGDDNVLDRFTAAYDAIYASGRPAAAVARPVVHLAAVEVATLLDGEPIGGPAQRAYVIQRVELLERVRAQLEAGRLGSLDTALDPREAQALGRLELESATHSSLEALQRLTHREEPPG